MEGGRREPGPVAAETIFSAALALPAIERPGYVAEACGGDTGLRQRVEALLRAHEAPEGFLPERPGTTVAGLPIQSRGVPGPATERPGDHIGRYKLLQELGEGGCGVVYMAEQEQPVRRKVAVKVIKLGMDTRQVVARFEAERQALALMDHPNIARVLDAGATETGRPYFVMELVGGIRITDYCEQNHLDTRQRLELFIQVCRAIQHAHQKGVIHRDIKPSNVLVTTQDGVPVPKVIDFGIAKATQGRLTDQTFFTAFEQFLGTPAYMSPEQAQLGALDVDTRSDIYSLGVLLYELLTGKTPFDTRELAAAGLDEMRRTIREVEPVRPSTRLAQALLAVQRSGTSSRKSTRGMPVPAGGTADADARRRMWLKEQINRVRGDLDWIVMKCLEKNRARRYETANGLARDLERYLGQEPIMARPPSAVYRIHKFIRRNSVLAAAATAIATVLVLGIAVSSCETARALRAERERTRLLVEAQAARREATEQLWRAQLAEARALRVSGQAGRHFETLAVLEKAAAIRPSLALRNEAIAGLVSPDIRWIGGKQSRKDTRSIAIDPTFARYALCEATGAVSVRKLPSDEVEVRLPAVGAAATLVDTFSPDGRFLPVGYAEGRLRVWDWAQKAVAVEAGAFRTIGFTPDSRVIGISDATNLFLYDLANGQRRNGISLSGLATPGAPGCFRFDPTGRRLALFQTEAATRVLILETAGGRTLQTLPHAARVWAVAWRPDGRHLATSCDDHTIQVWDSTSGERIRMWQTETIVSIGFNRRGNLLVSSSWDGYTRLWDFGTGRHLVSIYKSGNIGGFSPDDSRVATVSWAGTGLDLFEVAPGEGLRTLYETLVPLTYGGGWPVSDSTGQRLAFGTREGVGLWDVASATQIGSLVVEKQGALVGFDADGKNLLLTGPAGLYRCPITKSGSGRQYDLGTPILVSTECADPSQGRIGAVSADGRVCGIVGDNRCQVFRTDTFEKQAETGIQPGMRFIHLNRDGSLIASGAWHYPGVKVWSGQTGALVKELPSSEDSPDPGTTVAFSADGRWLVTSLCSEYCFWDTVTWSMVRRIPQEPGNDFSAAMAFSRDGRLFAGTHSRNRIRLHDASTGEVLADLEAPNSRSVTGLVFDGDARQLFAYESANALRVWDLQFLRRQLSGLGLDWDSPSPPRTVSAAAPSLSRSNASPVPGRH